ncbi:MAG: cellulase family glycosylhydrolase, partial [Acidimicrobiales bacterium]
MTTSTGPPSPPSSRRRARVLQVGVVLIALAIVQLGLGPIKATPASATVGFSGPPVVRVSGDHLVNGSGTPIRLIGVGQPGTESTCVAAEGFFSPPNSDTPSWIAKMKSWKINSVRLPLNEDCWLGINLPYPQFGGTAYRTAIAQYVSDLNAAGLAVILDLHWSAPGTQLATDGEVMADEDHSPKFWSSVAATFKGHSGVVFDLYNEPRHLPFSCLVHGGCVENGVKVAGYNQLISDVRATGATNVIMVAGIDFAANPT